MATASPTQGSSARVSITRPEQAQAAPGVQVDAPSRREFLYYIWGASMAMMLGQFTVIGLWFAFPRFREGEFGGVFPFNPADLPSVGSAPDWIAAGRFHVSHTETGLLALYGVCTHLGCLPKWVPTNIRFECPCHGSKYQINGSYIEGPAPRGLDRFPVTITYGDGTVIQTDTTDGRPLQLDPDKEIIDIKVDTGARILGPAHGVNLV